MAIPEDSERLTERDHQMWRDYAVMSLTQQQIADKYDVSQGLVSRRIRMVRDSLPKQTRDEIVADRVETLRAVTNAVIPAALTGDKDAVKTLLELQTRESKLLGLDSATKQEVTADTTVRYVIDLGD